MIIDKPEENNTKISTFWRKRRFLIFLTLLFILQACKQTNGNYDNEGTPGSESVSEIVREPIRQQGREAILVRGNYWTNGIPGFDDNSFPALTGEYRLRAAQELRSGDGNNFWVYLCSENLYFSGEWQPRRGLGNLQVFQRSANEDFMAAAVLDDGRGVLWTAVFRFPFGLEGAALNSETLDQMLRNWCSRLLYFMSLARTRGDISIPAVVEF